MQNVERSKFASLGFAELSNGAVLQEQDLDRGIEALRQQPFQESRHSPYELTLVVITFARIEDKMRMNEFGMLEVVHQKYGLFSGMIIRCETPPMDSFGLG